MYFLAFRHLLLQIQSGKVPPIVFKKDITFARERLVEELLKGLDLGHSDDELDKSDERGHDLEQSQKGHDKTLNSDEQNALDLDGVETYTHISDFDHKVKQMVKKNNVRGSDIRLQGKDRGQDVSSDITPHGDMDSAAVFRQDLYGLQHSTLMAKIIEAKSSVHWEKEAKQAELSKAKTAEAIERGPSKFKNDKKNAFKTFKISSRKLERMARESVLEEDRFIDG